MKKLYLVTEPGFISRFAINILTMVALILAIRANEHTSWMIADSYEWMKLRLLASAHALGWWSAIGMLSSSCCVLQILLNLAGVGCAGFNSWLGPLRPTTLAACLICQAISWHIAYPRPWQWGPTACSTVFSALLTFSPEILDAVHQGKTSKERHATLGNEEDSMRITLQLAPGSIGCISCVATVEAALKSCPGVRDCGANVNGEVYAVVATNKSPNDVDRDRCAAYLLVALETAGFPGTSTSMQRCDAPINVTETNGNSGNRRSKPWILGSVAGGLLGSSCCLLQLLLNWLSTLNVLHIGCAGFNKVLGPLRPFLRTCTGIWLAFAWFTQVWSTFSRPRGASSSTGYGQSHPWRSSWLRLAVCTAVCALLTFLPELLLAMGGRALAPPTSMSEIVPLRIKGMGCEACQLQVKSVFERSSGVISAHVDFKLGTAEILVAKNWSFDIVQVNRSLFVHGFSITAHEKSVDSDSKTTTSPKLVKAVHKCNSTSNLPEKIADPESRKPEGWDEDEDGIWEPSLIENPALASCTSS